MKSHRVADEESDIPPPEAFAQELAIDHLIVSKTSSEKEFAVLVVREGYSGVIQAYRSAAKDSLVAGMPSEVCSATSSILCNRVRHCTRHYVDTQSPVLIGRCIPAMS